MLISTGVFVSSTIFMADSSIGDKVITPIVRLFSPAPRAFTATNLKHVII